MKNFYFYHKLLHILERFFLFFKQAYKGGFGCPFIAYKFSSLYTLYSYDSTLQVETDVK